MNRRALLTGASLVATSHALAQPLPIYGPVGGPSFNRGPLSIVPSGATLDLQFMTGALDARLTFTRGSTATYFDSSGTMQTVSGNTPRFDYDPVTHAALGLLIEEQRTNLLINSGAMHTYPPSAGIVTAPIITGNATVAPDGTASGTQLAFPAVSGAGAYSYIYGAATVTAGVQTLSVWLRGNVGGEQVAISVFDAVTIYYTTVAVLTTAWRRFSVVTSSLVAGTWYITVGTDLRNAGQTSKPPQTIFVWGAQLEQGAFPTSYIPTTASAVTRSADQCSIQPAQMGFYVSPGGSWMAEFIYNKPPTTYERVVYSGPINTYAMIGITSTSNGYQFDNVGIVTTANTATVGAIVKVASTWAASTGQICLNGGAVVSGSMTAGYASAATNGIQFMTAAGTPAPESIPGYIRRVRYWPRVLSNAELQSVTI